MNFQHVRGVFLRQGYVTLHSFYRWTEIGFWPVVDVVMWGFLMVYLQESSGGATSPAAFLLGAAILWNVILRGQVWMGVAFLEETWSRNLLNVMVTPVTPFEYLVGSALIGTAKVVAGAAIASVLAWLAYAFSITSLGWSLLPFAVNLMVTGIVLGLVVLALVIRFGPGVEVLAWALAFVILPISAVFFPVSVLPEPLRVLAFFWPASHIFEGMRTVLGGGALPWGEVVAASLLNVAYFVGALALAWRSLVMLRRRGYITRYL